MAQTYSQIQAQIAKLQAGAERLRKAELAEVIARIRAAISAYSISPEDLFGGKSKKSPASKSAAGSKPSSKSKSKGDLTARFADDAGHSWVGRGPRPTWLREALEQGRELSEFAVQGSSALAPAVSSAPKASKKVADKTNGKAAKKQVAVKYRDGAGNSWTGRGSQPEWLKEAVATGKNSDEFLV